MCRFALVHSAKPQPPEPFLKAFSDSAERSRTPDGDRQEDGWGAAWLDQDGVWREHRSLAPIWAERGFFRELPPTASFAIHARSASFPAHKNVLEFNQPFASGTHAFVFNGHLQGVQLNAPGRIGAQKTWNLLRERLEKGTPPAQALSEISSLLEKNSKNITGLNMGLINAGSMAAMSMPSIYPDYYRLWSTRSREHSIISSEPLGQGYDPVPTGTVLRLPKPVI